MRNEVVSTRQRKPSILDGVGLRKMCANISPVQKQYRQTVDERNGNGASKSEYQIGSPDGADILTLRRFAPKLTASHLMLGERRPRRHVSNFLLLASSEEGSFSYKKI